MLLRFAPLAILPLLLLGGLAAYFTAAAVAPPKNVYLVGGLTRPYEVLVNGQPQQVPAMGVRKFSAEWGELRIDPAPGGPPIQPVTVTIEASLVTRPLGQPVYAINPDRTALIEWEKAYYSDAATASREGEYRVHVGQPSYRFDDIDFVWEELPEVIETQSTSGFWRQNLQVMEDMNEPMAVLFIGQHADEDAIEAYVRETIRLEPDRGAIVQSVGFMFEPEDALAALAPALAHRPVNVHAHRVYQTTMENLGRTDELVVTYRALHDADPTDGAFAYLLGRVLPSRSESRGLFERAISADPPSPWGHHALAFMLANAGDFERALAHAREAVAGLPEESAPQWIEEEMLAATGRWADVAARRRKAWDAGPDRAWGCETLVRCYMLAGDTDAAQTIIDQALARGRAEATPEQEAETLLWYRALLAQARAEGAADEAALLEALDQQADDVSARFHAAMLREDWPAAADAMEADEDPFGPFDHLLLYAALQRAGDTAAADARRARAVEMLRAGDADGARLADWLDGETAPDDEAVASCDWIPSDRRIVLLALAARFPDHAVAWRELAARLNYDRAVPHQFIARMAADQLPAP